jgi:hypothetical protein
MSNRKIPKSGGFGRHRIGLLRIESKDGSGGGVRAAPLLPSQDAMDLNNLSSTASVTHADCRRIAAEFIESCKFFNFVLEAVGLPGELDFSNVQRMYDQDEYTREWIKAIRPVVHGTFKGVLTEEHILSIVWASFKFLEDEELFLLLWGACQGAKTIVFCFLVLFLPVLSKVRDDKLLIPIINCPNQNNLQISTQKELTTLYNLYSNVRFVDRATGKSESLGYVDDILVENLRPTKGGEGITDWGDLVLQRNLSNIKKFANIKKSENAIIVSFTDEIHLGAAVNSVADQMQKDFKECNPDITLRHIGVTATPSEIIESSEWNIIPMFIPANYRGITQYCGQQLPTISGEIPPVQDILVVEREFPNDEEFENSEKYEDVSVFATSAGNHNHLISRVLKVQADIANTRSKSRIDELKKDEKEALDELHPGGLKEVKEWHRRHDAYRGRFAEWIRHIYLSCVEKEYPFVFLRPFWHVNNCSDLDKRLQGLLDQKKDCVIQFYGPLDDAFAGRSIREVLIENYYRNNLNGLVLATDGRSKMGDSYPKQCAHYIDLLSTRWCWNTYIQSTSGRSQGFKPKSVCYFTEAYATELLKFIEDGCWDEEMKKKYCQRSVYKDGKRGRPSRQFSYSFVEGC